MRVGWRANLSRHARLLGCAVLLLMALDCARRGGASVRRTVCRNPTIHLQGAATTLGFIAQPGNTRAGALITPAVQVAVQSACGCTQTGATNAITLSIGTNPAGGTLSGTKTISAVSGVATFPDLSIDQAGNGYRLTATSPGLANATSGSFNITSAAPSKLAFTVQGSDAVAGTAIAPAIRVTILDESDGTVTTATNSVTCAFANNAGGGTLSGTRTVNAVNGVATFADLNVNRAASGYTLQASSPGLTGATSSPFNISAGAASKLVFSVQPGNSTSGAPVTPAVQVTVQDALSNTVTTATNGITIALGANPSAGTLSGTKTVNAVNGVATFSDLSIDRAGSGYTLTASASGLTGAASVPFDIITSAASKLIFMTPPSSTAAGTPISPAMQVAVQDASGNTVASATHNVTVSFGSNPGNATLTGTKTVNAVNGVATFAGLSINIVANGYTLVVTASGLAQATSAPFDITVPPFVASYPQGLHLISIPRDLSTLSNNDLANLFQLSPVNAKMALWDAAAQQYVLFNGPGFSTQNNLKRGMWVSLPQTVTVSANGALASGLVRWNLTQGWNLVGNPRDASLRFDSTRIRVIQGGADRGALKDVVLANANSPIVEPFAWIYDNASASYQLVTDTDNDLINLSAFQPAFTVKNVVPRGAGCWLFCSASDVALQFDDSVFAVATLRGETTQRSKRSARLPADSNGWAAILSAQIGQVRDSVIFGINSAYGTVGFLAQKPPMPAMQSRSVRVALQRNENATGLGFDFRSALESNPFWNVSVATNIANEDVTLNWPRLSAVRGRLRFTLVDLATGARQFMNTTGSYRFRSGGSGTRRFRIEVSADTGARLMLQNVQAQALRSQAGSALHVAYSLSRDAQVSVRLLNPAGKLVNQMPLQLARTGLNNIVIEARDSAGRVPARGVYLVELTARADDGDEVHALKSTVIK